MSLFSQLDYKLRTRKASLPPSNEKVNDGLQCRTTGVLGDIPFCRPANYFHSGFMSIQSAVEMSWLRKQQPGIFSYPKDLQLQLFPKEYAIGTNWLILRSIIPLYLVISLSQFVPPMLMVVVEEKEKKIKESMKMVGLRSSVFW